MGRQCSECNSSQTRIHKTKNGTPYDLWHRDKRNGWLCDRCAKRLIFNPRNNKKWNPINNPVYSKTYSKRRFHYKNKIKYASQNPRVGICSSCKKQGKTGLHHMKYHDDDPLKDTVELCASCHGKQHGRGHSFM